MQPIKINSTEAELPQELQDQSTSGEDGSQVLTFTTKEIREKKPELLAYIKVFLMRYFLYKHDVQDREYHLGRIFKISSTNSKSLKCLVP